VGQHNFKIDDTYDLQCTARHLSVLYPPTGSARNDVLAADAALTADGWAAEGLGVQRLRESSRLEGHLVSYRRGARRVTLHAATQGGYGEYELDRLPPFRTIGGVEILAAAVTRQAPVGGYTLLVDVADIYFEE